MKIVKIQTIREGPDFKEVLDENFVVGESIGDCLDSCAPDPREGSIFKVYVISREALHA